MLGTGALMFYSDQTCVVDTTLRYTEFYEHESCGKCTPCREGGYWLSQVLRRIETGTGPHGGPRPAPGHLRQHLRAQLLRAR